MIQTDKFDVAKKLTLWHSKTFRPIMTHDELEPIMVSIGFVPLPMSATRGATRGGHLAWREYVFRLGACRGYRPRPRLPYPKIDGVHLLGYQAFFYALEFYLGAHQVPDIFHVRSMSFIAQERVLFDTVYRPIKDCVLDDDEGFFVYRDGTLDSITEMVCSNIISKECNKESSKSNNSNNNSSFLKKSSNSSICLVPMNELFPVTDIISFS